MVKRELGLHLNLFSRAFLHNTNINRGIKMKDIEKIAIIILIIILGYLFGKSVGWW